MRPPPCASLEENAIRRLSALAALAVCLVTAGGAFASGYTVQMRDGVKSASRSTTGSCTIAPASGWGHPLALRCGAAGGRATARYDFTVPEGTGSVAYQVYTDSPHGTLTKQLVRSGSHVSITVSLRGASAHVEVISTAIEYYSQSQH